MEDNRSMNQNIVEWLKRKGFDRYIIKNFNRINKLATLRLRKFNRNKSGYSAVAMKGARVSIAKSACIETTKGRFILNARWNNQDPSHSLLVLEDNSKLISKGSFEIYSGSKIYINKGATLMIGSGYANHSLNISCFDEISIGDGVVISENVTIRDSDNHSILGSKGPMTQPIHIEDKVWIGMNVTILKGVTIGKGAIIAAGAVVNKDVPANSLMGGVPASILKTDITWC